METRALKRRTLVMLSASSIAVIIALWALYLNYAVEFPAYGEPAGPTPSDIFRTGLSTTIETIETGLANAYLYFHDTITTPNTIIIERK